MMKKNVLIIGAGGVAHVAAHKAAHAERCARRHLHRLAHRCRSVRRSSTASGARATSRTRRGKLHARQLDALDVAATAALIRETESEIVINLGSAFINMSVLEACLETGAAYIDTAIHEEPDKVCEDPPWYANYEWKQPRTAAPRRASRRSWASGFDPGVVNAYCALAAKTYFDTIDTIDILDVNAGSPRQVLRHQLRPGDQLPRVRQGLDLDRPPVEGVPDPRGQAHLRLPGRRRAARLPQRPRRAALAVEEHRRQQHPLLDGLRRPLHQRVHRAAHARSAVARAGHARRRRRGGPAARWSRPCCPIRRRWPPATPARPASATSSRAPRTASPARCSSTRCRDHAEAYAEVESQGISYTAGVPPVAAAVLVAQGTWDAGNDGQRRRTRPRAVHRAARPDRPADRVPRDRARLRPIVRRRGRRDRRRDRPVDRDGHRVGRRSDDRRPPPVNRFTILPDEGAMCGGGRCAARDLAALVHGPTPVVTARATSVAANSTHASHPPRDAIRIDHGTTPRSVETCAAAG